MSERSRDVVYSNGPWEIDLARRELRSKGVPVPIGGRAFDIIDVLLRSASKLVSKRDLIESVWQGMIVEDNTIQVHIAAIRRALGPDRDMLQTVSGRGYRLIGEWTAKRAAPQAPVAQASVTPTATPVSGNFPLASSTLVGRTTAVATVRDLLSASRVVSLTGPGGIGKTRLAIEAARGLLPAFEEDGWFIELASLSDPDLVASAVAVSIGLGLVSGSVSPFSVAWAIGDRKILLLLDNCEHVISGVAGLVETIVRTCPRAIVLTTSREVLRIEGEMVWRVPPLEFPAPEEVRSDVLAENSAVQLFIARIDALRSNVATSGIELPDIAAICRRLDGIPLAIEFAAARAATIGIAQVLSRLEDRFRLLIGGRRTALPRHQTLRAALDWSHDLLPEAERRLFRQLAVFVAGFTLEAAAAVVTPNEASMLPVADGIASLVAKSLITLDNDGGRTRWHMLETIRAFAFDKLTEDGDIGLVQKRHASWFRDLISAAAPRPATAEQMDQCLCEIHNIRAALDWAFSEGGDNKIGIELTAAYVPVWLRLSQVAESCERCQQALDRFDQGTPLDPRLRVRLLIARGCVSLSQTAGSTESVETDLAKALEIAESLADEDVHMRALWANWQHHVGRADYLQAHAALDRLAHLAAKVNNPTRIFIADKLLGYTFHFRGDNRAARYHLKRAFSAASVLSGLEQDIWFQYDQILVARTMMARVSWMQGLLDQAIAMARDALEEAFAADQKLSVCSIFAQAVCPIAIMTGDEAEARRTVAELIEFATRYELPYWRRRGSCLEAERLIWQGDSRAGCDLLRKTLDEIQRMGRDAYSLQFLGALATGLAAEGHAAQGLATVDEAMKRSSSGGEAWCVPDLLRVKGELLLQQGEEELAENCFLAALDTGRRQDALFWQLRAAQSLSALRLRQNRVEDAHDVLALAYGQFVEGFDTPVLRAARTQIDRIRPIGRASSR